jgi:hypothetical protein
MGITYNDQRDISLKEMVGQFAKNAIVQMYTQLPCLITKYDEVNMIASIQPLTKQWIYDEDLKGGGSSFEMQEIREVSVAFPRAGNLVQTWPVQVGDECLVEFMHKSSVNAIKTGNIGELLHLDNGNIQDAIAVLKQFSLPKHQEVVTPSTTAGELRTVDGTASISLNDDGTQAQVKIGGTTFTVIDGTVTIDGANLVVSGNITSSNGSFAAPNGDLTTSIAPSYNGHIHIDAEARDTSTPSVPTN